MTFRPSEPTTRHFPNLGTLALALLLLSSGCAMFGGRSRDWYSGPEEHRDATQDAINNALTELPREIGRDLKWDWNRNRVTIKVVEPTHYTRGIPQVTTPESRPGANDGRPSGGWATPGTITLPRGFRIGTLRHEGGHIVLFANGIPSPTFDTHHEMAPDSSNVTLTNGNIVTNNLATTTSTHGPRRESLRGFNEG